MIARIDEKSLSEVPRETGVHRGLHPNEHGRLGWDRKLSSERNREGGSIRAGMDEDGLWKG